MTERRTSSETLSRSEMSVLSAMQATGGGFVPHKFAVLAAQMAEAGLLRREWRADVAQGVNRWWYELTPKGASEARRMVYP